MSDFDYEVMQRKILARQAKYRKCGSKSKRCTLPTDNMTHKQWKERNGTVLQYSMNKPMTWDTFKQLSKNTQEEYLKHLMSTYGATISRLADMFGVAVNSVRYHVKNRGMDIDMSGTKRMSKEQVAVWQRFLADECDEVCEVLEIVDGASELATHTDESCDSLEPVPVVNNFVMSVVDEQSVMSGAIVHRPEKPKMSMTNFSLRFNGSLSVEAIMNSLRHIIGRDSVGEIEIVYNLI